MKHKYCLLAILLPVLNGCAQNKPVTKPLHIGDTIPPIILTDVINFPVSKIKLDNNNNKLVILDFWATWCGSCFKKFPFVDSVQKAFSDKLQIILVNSITGTGDTKESILNFYNKRIKAKFHSFSPPIVIGDTLLKTMFPHKYVPHYVWIDAWGKVIAITSSGGFTVENIIAALNKKTINDSSSVFRTTHDNNLNN